MNSVFGIGVFAAILMIPAIWNYLVGYGVGTAIAVIGLYIAFILPVYLRLRQGDSWDPPRAWSLGKHYKWIDTIAILWVALITILFVFPLYRAGLPWEDDFTWELTNYTVLWFAAIGIVFGGWWFVSAKNWFTGPCAHGHRGGARAAGGGAARPRSGFRRSRHVAARLAVTTARGAAAGAPRAFPERPRRRNPGSAAVRSIRSKCSAA